uniref:Uncharacterized protein MANES_01G110300 n=2 Tax=Rhizophora mucronata TaxID=61149 RepID=A0A2P2JVP6_RHIMU
MVTVEGEMAELCSHCQTGHLELQGLKPCVVVIHKRMVGMMPPGNQVSPHYILPEINHDSISFRCPSDERATSKDSTFMGN